MSYTAEAFNLDALAYAVAVAETSNCTAGTALSANNCHGILKRDHTPVVYETTQESFLAFKDLWSRLYENRFPDYTLAYKYTGGDATNQWLETVTIAYNNYQQQP